MNTEKNDFKKLSIKEHSVFSSDLAMLEWRLNEMVMPMNADEMIAKARENAFSKSKKID